MTAAAEGVGLRVPVGTGQHPVLECVRFRAHVSLSFPSSEIAQVQVRGHDSGAYPRRYEMATTFMGLAGAQGVLPHHYTQMILRRRREQDEAFRHFLDLFHHRIISIYYRAWQRSRFVVQWEETRLRQDSLKEDRFTQSIYSLTGFGNGALLDTRLVSSSIRNRLSFSDHVLLQYSGLLSHRPRNAESLQRMLRALFSIPVEVRQRQGQWVHLSPEDQTRMPGREISALRSNSRLGESAMAGEKVWSIESKVRIVAGPLTLAEFSKFCPGQAGFTMLSQIVRLWVGPDLDVDLQIILKKEEVPRTSLRASEGLGLLGWTTWIGNQPAEKNCNDAVFMLQGDPLQTVS